MDDAVRRLRGITQTIQLRHIAAEDLHPNAAERLSAGVRTAERDHMMARLDELRNQVGADEPRGAC